MYPVNNSVFVKHAPLNRKGSNCAMYVLAELDGKQEFERVNLAPVIQQSYCYHAIIELLLVV